MDLEPWESWINTDQIWEIWERRKFMGSKSSENMIVLFFK